MILRRLTLALSFLLLVCLTRRDGKRYLIGSERSEELLRALEQRGVAH